MTHGPTPAKFVLERCVTLRKGLNKPELLKSPEIAARYDRLGMLEDLARHVAHHDEQDQSKAKWDQRVPRVLYLSGEDFVLIALEADETKRAT